MRILLVEDDPALVDVLTRMCKRAGYNIDAVNDGVAADLALTAENYDAMLLDLGLPRMDGLEVLQKLRRRGDMLPVMILTARDAIADRVQGLDSGADDYLAKPFDIEELQARLRAMLRRQQGNKQAETLVLGKLSFNTNNWQTYMGEQEIELSRREREILACLVFKANKVVSKRMLISSLSSWDASLGVNAIEVYIHRLRKKLECGGVSIRTIRGLGYLIEPTE